MWITSIVALALVGAPEAAPRGHLVVVGGGQTPREASERLMDLAGGPSARVVVVPQASIDPEAGRRMLARWHDDGVKQVDVLDPSDPKAAIAAVKEADLIWIRGGNQNRLMGELTGTGIPEAIRLRYLRGGTIGGTSAGAAVMSRVMIAGRDADKPGAARLSEGLGLWPEVIVDQHFLRRKRFDRLKGAVLEHPELVGIGIDESTAVVVSGREFEVIGKGQVIVIDARKAAREKTRRAGAESGDGVVTHVLRAGMKYHLDKGILTEPVPTGG